MGGLSIAILALSIATTLLTNQQHKHEQAKMKESITKDVLKALSKKED